MMPCIPTLVAILLILHSSDASLRVDPLVNTNLGLIRGVRATDGNYAMFMGIPYAQVNASNPFGKAIPQEPFDDVFEADDDSAICPQIEEFNKTTTGSLDCLHLNVYVPTIANTANPVPVLVWIYGGGFSIGFAGRLLYGPKYIVRHDVILVTLNYRVGAYGFMCLDTPENPGNEGFKDQLLALRWVKENIQAFGGDPNKITLFGESAGGISVDFQILTQKEKLFDRAILQSGTSLLPTFPEPLKNSPLILAEHLGYVTNDINDALSFLSNADTNLIIDATSELGLNFRPCVEKQFEGVESFITEDWKQAPMPKVNGMPILIGFNDHERLSNYFGDTAGEFNAFDVFKARLNLAFNISDSNFNGMEELAQRFYLGDEEVSAEQVMDVIDFDSDIHFNHPTYRSIAKYLDNDAANIYFYMFSYVGNRNFVKRKNNINIGGAAHADEIGYLFDISLYEETPTDDDQRVIDQMTTLWTNFAKYGNPTPEISELLPFEWTPIKKGSPYHYLDLGSELKMGTRPFHRRMAFWDLFYRANRDLEIVYPGSD
ncbi:juvenile hormone esterase-like [Ostrinia nubilalis]|uniref:juvenile hormone esterase-like n=1 Tax=Ostrinia nubilalis TaxID=29057 RepID=UPI003082223E